MQVPPARRVTQEEGLVTVSQTNGPAVNSRPASGPGVGPAGFSGGVGGVYGSSHLIGGPGVQSQSQSQARGSGGILEGRKKQRIQ
jgi:hypothetical protein